MLDESLTELEDASILAVTSKIVSICEGNVVPFGTVSKDELIKRESAYWLPAEQSKYGHHFSITRSTLISSAGIDESNGEGYHILWPKDAQKSANDIRRYLRERFGVKRVGVVITDSTCQPLRRGTVGIELAHSGFAALRNYIGQPDLFGRPLAVTQASVAAGLAATAVVAMGEGAERTPLCVISDVGFVDFQDRDPSAEELAEITIDPKDDLFAPFLSSVKWEKGQGK